MQATHFVPDEVVGKHGLRVPADLQAHSNFAEDVLGERRRLIDSHVGSGALSVWQGLLYYLRGRQWVAGVWGLETVWLLLVAGVCGYEAWGECPTAFGMRPACRYCYSGPLLVWNTGLLVVWMLNLYLSVLLVSRGFQLKLRPVSLVDNEIKGIPKEALQLFLILSALLALWYVAGAVLLILSSMCTQELPQGYGHPHGRSWPLIWTSLGSLILGPTLQCLSRFSS